MKRLTTKLNRFLFLGLALAYSQDALPPFKYSIARNIRQYVKGVITQRAGMTPFNSSAVAATSIHSITRLNDDTPTAAQAFTRIIATSGGILYTDNAAHNAFTQRSVSYSGNPLTFAVFRPNNSPVPYVYTGDTFKMEKVRVDGSVAKMGIVPPSTPPTARHAAPTRTRIDDFTTSGWTPGGNAFPPAAVGGAWSITSILYDTGSTGWANVEPSTFTQLPQEGAFVRFVDGANNEIAIIDQVMKAIKTTTIQSITYDAGTTGLCTIVLSATGRKNLVKDALIQINTEKVRIQSVTIGDDDTKSFRCSTASNHVAGETVTGIKSWRVYLNATYTTATGSISPRALSVVTGAITGASWLDKTVALDLSSVSGREVQDDDEVCFVVNFDLPQYVSEVQLYLYTTFQTDYYLKTFRPSDFQPIVDKTIPTTPVNQGAIQSQLVDDVNPPFDEALQTRRDRLLRKFERLAGEGASAERLGQLQNRINRLGNKIIRRAIPPVKSETTTLTTGASGTSTIKCKVSDLKRVGGDTTQSLKDVSAIRFLFITNDAQAVTAQITGWWIGGAYGADVGDIGKPYQYRYRYRSKVTGAKSYPSPPMRSGVLPRRERIALTPVASADAQVDAIDWYRYGGVLEDWHYIGTGANSTATFNDDFPDDVIASKPTLRFDNFVPFPVADLPKTGTVNTVGTKITRASGEFFNTKWAEGSVIIIDGVRCTLYGSPSTTGLLEINENIGTKTGVSFYMPQPIIADTPLPCIWSSLEGDKANVIFACGDSFNAGTLYWTNADDPDSASDQNYLEVCPPSEPLMNGFVYDSRNYVFSSDNLYLIYPIARPDGSLGFTSNRTPLGKGIAGRYAFCVGDGGIWFVDRDGIYFTNGSTPQSLTDEDLYPLFPHDGQVGTTTNGVIAPDFTSPNNLRLAVGDSYLRFEYLGIDANRYTLIFDIVNKTWCLDSYSPNIVASYFELGRQTHNWLIGATDGRLYSNTGQGDGASSNTAISCQFRTKAEDLDNPRSRKLWGDASLDLEVSNVGLQPTVTLGFDNYTATLSPVSVTLASPNVRQQTPIDINSGSGIYAKNATMDVAWSSGTATAKFYNWSFTYDPETVEPNDTDLTATPADDLGFAGNKFIQGFRITANTYGAAKSFKVQADTGVNGAWADIQSFTLTIAQEATTAFSFEPPFVAHNVRIIGTDTDDWSLSNYEFIFEPEPETVLSYTTQPTTHDLEGYQHVKDAYISLLSTADVTLTITIDGTNYTYTFTSTGGAKQKIYKIFKAIKGKYFTYSFTSTQGFRLYEKDSLVNVHDWQAGQYLQAHPFGHPTRVSGALI